MPAARSTSRASAKLRDYQQRCLRLGIPLADGDEVEEQRHEDHEDGGFLEGEDGDYYPELRCYNGEYYYDDGQEGSEEDAVVVDLENRICLLELNNQAKVWIVVPYIEVLNAQNNFTGRCMNVEDDLQMRHCRSRPHRKLKTEMCKK